MVVFPNAKINLGLNILSGRKDGYHNIESCLYPVELSDILEIVRSDTLQFTSSGRAIAGAVDDNLCLKAYRLLKSDFDIDPVKIHLHKIIPIGAGLGGGSSDAAFTLKLLNEKFELSLDAARLERYAARLGSDCPFFIRNKPVIAQGVGTEFVPAATDLSRYRIEIQFPDIHISSKEAYAGVVPKWPEIPIASIISFSPDYWKGRLKNDFEATIFPNHPEVETLKNRMYACGALYASMTGSGSAVYGIYDA